MLFDGVPWRDRSSCVVLSLTEGTELTQAAFFSVTIGRCLRVLSENYADVNPGFCTCLRR